MAIFKQSLSDRANRMFTAFDYERREYKQLYTYTAIVHGQEVKIRRFEPSRPKELEHYMPTTSDGMGLTNWAECNIGEPDIFYTSAEGICNKGQSKPLPPSKISRIEELHTKGLSTAAICTRLGLSSTTVRRHIENMEG